jgi:hypothetical protein
MMDSVLSVVREAQLQWNARLEKWLVDYGVTKENAHEHVLEEHDKVTHKLYILRRQGVLVSVNAWPPIRFVADGEPYPPEDDQ